MRRSRFLSLALVSIAALAAGATSLLATPTAPKAPPAPRAADEVRIGYFPNLTHAPGIVAVDKGLFATALGGKKLTTATFNAGPAAVEALFSGALDLTYIGPNPAINAYVKSKGTAVRVIAGATSGGAYLVVDPSITGAADLKGKKLATPQLGNTQDVAARAWLKSQGFKIDLRGASDVQLLPQENAQTLDAFKNKQIAGAWVPEPWASRLQIEGGGKVLVDEKTLWPGGDYVTTNLLVSSEFLKKEPALVKKLLHAHVEAQLWIARNPDEAKKVVNDAIAKVTGKKIDEKLLNAAWPNLKFTNDPIATSLKKSAADAQEAGLLDLAGLDLAGIYDLSLLNEVLAERGLPAITP
jgi:NitT/TauT family transport system substrate-binding protein